MPSPCGHGFVGRSPDSVVGQAARYMDGFGHTWAEVQGIVVAHLCDDRLRYAAAAVPGLTIMTHRGQVRPATSTGIAAS
jgi:hypothetical protein